MIKKEVFNLKKIIAVLLALALLLCGCAGGEEKTKKETEKTEEKEVVLGIVLPMSDHEMIYGIQLAVNEINLSGGINGAQVLTTFLNYENGILRGTEGLEALEIPLFINLSNAPVRGILEETVSPVLTFAENTPGEYTFKLSGFDADGFEQLFKSKYSTKPNYTTAKAYEMIYITKDVMEASKSLRAGRLSAALNDFSEKSGKFHESVSVLQ